MTDDEMPAFVSGLASRRVNRRPRAERAWYRYRGRERFRPRVGLAAVV